MPRPPQPATITFMIHDGDDPSSFSSVGLLEHVHIVFSLEEHLWVVTSDEKAVWVGRADNRHAAILDYLRSRLGLTKDGKEEVIRDSKKRGH